MKIKPGASHLVTKRPTHLPQGGVSTLVPAKAAASTGAQVEVKADRDSYGPADQDQTAAGLDPVAMALAPRAWITPEQLASEDPALRQILEQSAATWPATLQAAAEQGPRALQATAREALQGELAGPSRVALQATAGQPHWLPDKDPEQLRDALDKDPYGVFLGPELYPQLIEAFPTLPFFGMDPRVLTQKVFNIDPAAPVMARPGQLKALHDAAQQVDAASGVLEESLAEIETLPRHQRPKDLVDNAELNLGLLKAHRALSANLTQGLAEEADQAGRVLRRYAAFAPDLAPKLEPIIARLDATVEQLGRGDEIDTQAALQDLSLAAAYAEELSIKLERRGLAVDPPA